MRYTLRELAPSPEVEVPPQGYVPHFVGRPHYCGVQGGMLVVAPDERDWSKRGPTPDQLNIEEWLQGMKIRNKGILHVGVGNSHLALRFGRLLAYVDGVTVSKKELNEGKLLHLKNYVIKVCNKYAGNFRSQLPHGKYDFIVDNNMSSYACCQFHFRTLLENYVKLLALGGKLLTEERGMSWSRTDAGWSLTPTDLAYVAAQHGMSVSCVRQTVYILSVVGA